MSHEIRSPLNVVMSFIELIKHDIGSELTDDLKISFNSIDSASTRIIRTIELILNMTDIQLGSYETHKIKLEIGRMIQGVKMNIFNLLKIKI